MTSCGMPFGQACEQAPPLVQPPKPSWSCWSTMETTRAIRSGWPWGSSERWVTLAPMKSMALAFGQAATQAPHPMHSAAVNARSAAGLGTGAAWASGADPVLTEM